MEQLEMVEKLSEKAKVSYEDARDALEASDWDMLEAMILLEKNGKMRREANYRTQPEPSDSEEGHANVKGVLRALVDWVVKAINWLVKVSLVITHRGKTVLELPLIVPALLLILGFYLIVPAFVISLFFGVRYSIRDAGNAAQVNQIMDTAADIAEKIKKGVRSESGKNE